MNPQPVPDRQEDALAIRPFVPEAAAPAKSPAEASAAPEGATKPTQQKARQPAITTSPLMVSAEVAARLCSISRDTWDRWSAAGLNPEPRRIGGRRKGKRLIGGRPLWSLRELEDWIAAGCPDRSEWEAIRDRARRP